MATKAAKKLFNDFKVDPHIFDFLILVTQTPDYLLPTTACIVHQELNLRNDAFALDINLGCSGFVAALGQAKGLIVAGQASNVLIITSDTYTKLINPSDRSVRTIFGDGATATWISDDGNAESLHDFIYGTDGSGAGALIVPSGPLRPGTEISPASEPELRGLVKSQFDLYMDGSEIFNFTIKISEVVFKKIYEKDEHALNSTDYFVFHQANAFMLRHLRTKLKIPESKFPVLMKDWGNTVSSTIPMALSEMSKSGVFETPKRLVLFGFGVGLSWAAARVTMDPFKV